MLPLMHAGVTCVFTEMPDHCVVDTWPTPLPYLYNLLSMSTSAWPVQCMRVVSNILIKVI